MRGRLILLKTGESFMEREAILWDSEYLALANNARSKVVLLLISLNLGQVSFSVSAPPWLQPWPQPLRAAGGWPWPRSSKTCSSLPCCSAGAPCSSCSNLRASTRTRATSLVNSSRLHKNKNASEVTRTQRDFSVTTFKTGYTLKTKYHNSVFCS